MESISPTWAKAVGEQVRDVLFTTVNSTYTTPDSGLTYTYYSNTWQTALSFSATQLLRRNVSVAYLQELCVSVKWSKDALGCSLYSAAKTSILQPSSPFYGLTVWNSLLCTTVVAH